MPLWENILIVLGILKDEICYIIFITIFSDQPDTLICGNCKEMFRNIIDIINHKRHYCKLRFACKCLSTPAALSVLKASGVTFDFEGTNKGKTGIMHSNTRFCCNISTIEKVFESIYCFTKALRYILLLYTKM